MNSLHDENGGIDFIEEQFCRLKDEYKVQAFKNQQALETLKFTEKMLPDETKDLLETASQCCQILCLEDINQCNLLLKYTESFLEKNRFRELTFKSKQERRKIQKVLVELQEKISILERESEYSTKICQESQDIAKETSGKISFFREKAKAYETKIKEIKDSITPIDSELHLPSIIEDNVHLNALNEEIKRLQSKLNSYRKLPSDMTLAKERVKQAKIELENSQQELDKAIANLAQTL